MGNGGQIPKPIRINLFLYHLLCIFALYIFHIQAQLERLQAEIALSAKKTGIASAAKIATITPKKEIVRSTLCNELKYIF